MLLKKYFPLNNGKHKTVSLTLFLFRQLAKFFRKKVKELMNEWKERVVDTKERKEINVSSVCIIWCQLFDIISSYAGSNINNKEEL